MPVLSRDQIAASIFPVLGAPIAPVEPTTAYTGLLIWLSIAPKLDQGIVDANASIMAKPYRILADGSIDIAPESMTKTLHVASAVDALSGGQDAALGGAIAEISATLQTYLAAGL
jgi:hypothetical protein